MPLTDSLRDDILASVPSPSCVCDLAFRQWRPGDAWSGDAVARPGQHRLVPARLESAGVAVHDPAQPVRSD